MSQKDWPQWIGQGGLAVGGEGAAGARCQNTSSPVRTSSISRYPTMPMASANRPATTATHPYQGVGPRSSQAAIARAMLAPPKPNGQKKATTGAAQASAPAVPAARDRAHSSVLNIGSISEEGGAGLRASC